MKWQIIFSVSVFVLAMSCQKMEPAGPGEDQTLDGPVAGLTAAQKQQFLRGDAAFNGEIFTKETGLGPLFVATSCGSCHAGDGKGHPFTTLTRFGQTDSTGNHFLQQGAPQLQDRAIPGHEPEQVPTGAAFAKFTPPANTGMGFLDAVSDADIIAMADPNDADGDGISGVVNWTPLKPYLTPREGSIKNGGRHIGRFGKKAGAYDLLQQTAGAYNQDMGITSSYEPYDTYSGAEIDPEVTNQTLLDVVFYLKTLKAPVQRNATDKDVVKGKELFMQINCGKCHVPILKTAYSTITALSNVTFYPYTDLLLHDMGDGLNDGYTEGNAKPAEWRTPALWGLGLSKQSQGGSYYLLHDGRARSIEAAILLHGGEALQSKDSYKVLQSGDKELLIKFLESL
ncbi:thiol oxidoreductase [Flavipsychrobacter stenotrophus]|uniref:Thiol oxidoreductase n=1 Tax=Flavipsychrobacter stenotrophus TaxID=2077091 RepID=A0A2S7ST49_9BACT|nr:di-heme oxidoredictase family protein [Flavipsychrobacter stenotrophus]PQJ10100.1 thiol oxidoreductase [Flavipsychrobacter stenotrophus]